MMIHDVRYQPESRIINGESIRVHGQNQLNLAADLRHQPECSGLPAIAL